MKTKNSGISQNPAFPNPLFPKNRELPVTPMAARYGGRSVTVRPLTRILAALAITDPHHCNMIGMSSGNPDILNYSNETYLQCNIMTEIK